jgi:Oligosaccharyltransferase 48 kDa subunit beta
VTLESTLNVSIALHSSFFKASEFQADTAAVATSTTLLAQFCRFGSYAYDNIVLFAPTASLSGEALNVNSVMEFVQHGGNIIAAAGVTTSKAVRKLAAMSGVDFDAAGSVVSV